MSNIIEATNVLYTKYRDIIDLVSQGEAIKLAAMQGMGSMHELFEIPVLGLYVYVDRITDGPRTAIEGWHGKAHEFDAWGNNVVTHREMLMYLAGKVADIVDEG